MVLLSDLNSQMFKLALALIAISFQWPPRSLGLAIEQKEPISSQQTLVTNKRHQGDVASTIAETAKNHDNRRPIWALAHMVNSIKELDYRLSTGANAIEVDVTFSHDGLPLYTYHGPPCDCWRHCYQREDFREFLSYVREIAIDTPNGSGQNLSMLFLDLKLDPLDQYGKVRAGQELAKAVMGDLFIRSQKRAVAQRAAPFYLILSVNHVHDIDLVNNFMHTLEINNSSELMSRIGFDVGMNDDLRQIESMWRKFGATLNLWQGDGYTNCISPFYNLQRLSKAIAKRDTPSGYPAKVYHWTIDLHDRMRESLMLGVDAIMTNHPERLLTVLQEPEIAHDFRLATRLDDPFLRITRRPPGQVGETARFQRSVSSNSGGLIGNLMDILASWYNYIREIPLLSLPTTLVKSGKKKLPASGGSNETKLVITPVKLTNEPEYKLENVSSLANDTSDSIDRSSGGSQNSNSTELKSDLEYQPSWVVSLVSNLLVSALRSVLPT